MERSPDPRQFLLTPRGPQDTDKDTAGLASLSPSELGSRSHFRFQDALSYTQAFGTQLQPPNLGRAITAVMVMMIMITRQSGC